MKSRVNGESFSGSDLRKYERCNSNGKTVLGRFDRSSLVPRRFVALVFAAFFSFSMTGCGTEPQQEVVAAWAALDSAKAADADKYAPLKYHTECEMWHVADSEMSHQRNLPIFMRTYNKAEFYMMTVERQAYDARTASLETKKKMQMDVLNRIGELDTLIFKTTESLETKNRLKNGDG